MKALTRGLLMAFVLGVLIVGTASTEPVYHRFSPDSNLVLGAVTTTTATQRVLSPPKTIPWAPPFRVTVVVSDSGAGNGAATDSFAVSLVKWLDYENNTVANVDSLYTVIKTMPAMDPTKTFVLDQTFSVDSCNLGTFPLAGPFKFMLHKAGGQTLDTVNGDYDIDVYVEALGSKEHY